MKINIEIDATPQELRTFFGLPHVEAIQDELLEKMREKMLDNIEHLDMSNMMSQLMPDKLQSLDSIQKNFWEAMMGQVSESLKK